MLSLGGYCDHVMQSIGTQIMEMLSTDTIMPHFTQVGPSYQRNQRRRRFAKSARHHAGLESRLQNQAATTKTPPQHLAEEPDEHADAES